MTSSTFDVVIPTVGRPSLARTLDAVAAGPGPQPARVVVVDDRRCAGTRLLPGPLPDGTVVLAGGGRGPAAARNVGWRSGSSEWVAFLDDDVVPEPGWRARLAVDLAAGGPRTGASQGRIVVPLPEGRRPTDWERNVVGLATARWATADMAYRRAALADVGGFDERFPRAYREDADLAARVRAAGWRIVMGERVTTHPVRPAGRWVSVRLQSGNADDVLLRVLHGRHWRRATGVPSGRRRRHLAITAAAAGAVGAAAAGRPRLALAAATCWALGTAELAWARIAPGPRTAEEVVTMIASSVAIPPAATWHWLRGWAGLPRCLRAQPARRVEPPAAVLFDRDGTLVVDVPYNGDPALVVPMPGARQALDRLRAAGIPIGVVSNQSGVARRLVTAEQVAAVNRRVEELLGPLGSWAVCPHGPDDGCPSRKPAAGLVLEASAALGVDPTRVAVVGDIGSDVEAALRAGARAVLVPTAVTRPEEVASAPEVALDLPAAVDLLLRGAS
ncbi:MAG TPA: HAD-IIIA family hydrolase [Acidimicrobiales bacterium]|nr:HAD-IIIA family hydrolase [Acidimicrobiales bacterium]